MGGGTGTPGPPQLPPTPPPPPRSALLRWSETRIKLKATGQAALPPCVPHCAVLVDNFGISMQ